MLAFWIQREMNGFHRLEIFSVQTHGYLLEWQPVRAVIISKIPRVKHKMLALELKGTLVTSIHNKTTIPYWCYHIQRVYFITKCPQTFNLVKRKHEFSPEEVAILPRQDFQQHKANRAIQEEGETLAADNGSLEYFQVEPLAPFQMLVKAKLRHTLVCMCLCRLE